MKKRFTVVMIAFVLAIILSPFAFGASGVEPITNPNINTDTPLETINNIEQSICNELKGSITDIDNDGLTQKEEREYQTNPCKYDTDTDGLADNNEIFQYDTSPLSQDTDSDRLSDRYEVTHLGSPVDTNTDNDTYADYTEVRYGFNPAKITVKNGSDVDNDGLSKSQELQLNSDSSETDTDEDGISDSAEVFKTKLYPNSSPSQKDIYIEYDSYKKQYFLQEKFKNLQEVYNNAPKGEINLHFIHSETNLGNGHTQTNFSDLESIASNHFNHSDDVYYYMYVAQDVTIKSTDMNEDGIAKIRIFAIQPTGGTYILAHELGHAIGITNYEFDGVDSTKYKYKNYNSVMNYNWGRDPITYSRNKPFNDWKFIWNNIPPRKH